MAKKKNGGLGRGLSALIPDEPIDEIIEEYNKDSVREIDIKQIIPNPKQPRKDFDKEKLKELSESIKEHGLIQPIITIKENDKYIIVAGERRYKASILARLKKVPVIVKEFNNEEVLQVALIENIQREDLNEIEKALAYQELKDKFKMTQEEVAKTLGKSRVAIANTLRLLSLPGDIKDLIRKDILSAGHARAILSLEDKSLMKDFANYIVENNLSVREAEKEAKTFKQEEKQTRKEAKKTDPYVTDIEEKIAMKLGTKVKLNQKNGKGSIKIEFYSNEDLERLLTYFDLEEI